MKTLKLFSASLLCLVAISMKAKAQSTIKIGSGPTIKVDSLLTFKPDSNKFIKKPNYNAYNDAPVALPNACKPKQTLEAPMPILKILLKKED